MQFPISLDVTQTKTTLDPRSEPVATYRLVATDSHKTSVLSYGYRPRRSSVQLPLAGQEIEHFPCRVLKYTTPNVENYTHQRYSSCTIQETSFVLQSLVLHPSCAKTVELGPNQELRDFLECRTEHFAYQSPWLGTYSPFITDDRVIPAPLYSERTPAQPLPRASTQFQSSPSIRFTSRKDKSHPYGARKGSISSYASYYSLDSSDSNREPSSATARISQDSTCPTVVSTLDQVYDPASPSIYSVSSNTSPTNSTCSVISAHDLSYGPTTPSDILSRSDFDRNSSATPPPIVRVLPSDPAIALFNPHQALPRSQTSSCLPPLRRCLRRSQFEQRDPKPAQRVSTQKPFAARLLAALSKRCVSYKTPLPPLKRVSMHPELGTAWRKSRILDEKDVCEILPYTGGLSEWDEKALGSK